MYSRSVVVWGLSGSEFVIKEIEEMFCDDQYVLNLDCGGEWHGCINLLKIIK